MTGKAFNVLFLFVFISQAGFAQIDDYGLRTSVSLKHKFTRKLTGQFTEELRFHQEITSVDLILSEAGMEYDITKKLTAGFNYRFINKNQYSYYSKRHLVFVDVEWKEKAGKFSFVLRERLQRQVKDIYSSENGRYPERILRSKLTAKIDLNRRYNPYVSAEAYYILTSPGKPEKYFSRMRYETGISYKFNRVHSVNPYLLFQNNLPEEFNELIYGFSYTRTL